MEFPEDVLTIIRAYAKPRMRFAGEFKKILIELGLRDWPELRSKLCTSSSEQVIVALRAYKNVYLEAKFRLKEMNRPMYPRIMSHQRTEHVKCIQLCNKLYVDLLNLLSGPISEDMEDERFYRHFQPVIAPERPA
jgi:hypothetical protein